jgi:hypothetical protein
MKKPPGNAATELVRPWNAQWERWEVEGGGAPLLAESGGADAIHPAGRSILALPARTVIAAPLWIDSTDPAIVEESSRLELDVRGLLPRKGGGKDFVPRLLARDGRTLVVAAVFPAELPGGFQAPAFDSYEASPFLLGLEEDAVTLWREEDDLVAAFTSGRDVVCWETTRFTDDPEEISNWLRLLWLQLSGEGIVSGNLRLINHVAEIDRSRLRLPAVIQPVTLPKADGEPMPPALGAARFQWKPAAALAHERALRRKRQMRQIAFAVASAYAAIVLVLLGAWGVLQLQLGSLKAEAAKLGAEVDKFQPVAREWRVIAPTAESGFFPLEILHFLVGKLPDDGIRLTKFALAEGMVTVEGEANSVSMASDYYAAITQDEGLRQLRWEMPTPIMLPNNAAQFRIQGNYQIP